MGIGKHKRMIIQLLLFFTLERCKELRFLAESQMNEFKDAFPLVRGKIKKRYSGVMLDDQYKIKNFDSLNILFLGRIENSKGICEFVECARKVCNDPRFMFLVAGDGSQTQWLKNEIGDLNNIKYLGVVSGNEKRDLLMKCNVFCLLSDAEALPYALLENMMYGNIPIVTDVGEMGNIVQSQCSGYVIKKNAMDLLVALYEIIRFNECSIKMSERARMTVERQL